MEALTVVSVQGLHLAQHWAWSGHISKGLHTPKKVLLNKENFKSPFA